MTPHRSTRRAALACLACVTALAAGAAAAAFPDQPVKVVVGFGPGTGSDIQARAMADALSKDLKVPVVIDNRPGAAGMLAAASVSTAPPDGHTVLFGTTTLLITLPLMSANVRYDGVQDFTPIGTMGKSAFIVVTANKPGSPTTLAELLAAAKASNLSFGSIGNGSFGHLATMRILQQVGNVPATHVPYKSSAQELQDVATGQLAFAIDSGTATLPLIRNGLLRPLAVTSRERMQALPDVPTVAEVLGTEFEHAVWTGLLAPKGTPPAVIQRWSAALKATLDSKEVQERFNAMQLMPFALDAPAFDRHLRSEVPAWQAFFKKSGIRIQE